MDKEEFSLSPSKEIDLDTKIIESIEMSPSRESILSKDSSEKDIKRDFIKKELKKRNYSEDVFAIFLKSKKGVDLNL